MKYFLILFFLIATFSFSNALAQSGCCSWHSGVCGCGTNGRTICCDGTYSPSCTCGSGYDYTPATCTYDGKTYTDFSEARSAWDTSTRKLVDYAYPITLERTATWADYNYWYDKRPFNNCNGEGLSTQTIIDDIKTGQEYQHFLWEKAHKQNIKTQIILLLDRTPSDEEVNDWFARSDNIDVIVAGIKQTDEYIRHNEPFYYYLNKYQLYIFGGIGVLLFYLFIAFCKQKNN